MKFKHTICSIFILFFPYVYLTAKDLPDETYHTVNRLFYIERSKNKNIVCYDLNPGVKGKPDDKNPLSVYWINREEHPGQQDALSYIQSKLAFGYAIIGKHSGVIAIELNAVKDRKLTIEWDGEKYFCQTNINKQPSALYKIYVKTKTSNSIQVEYVDIYGYNVNTGLLVTERITP